MRYFLKSGTGGPSLISRHINPPQNSSQARRRWDRYKNRSRLLQDLRSEQLGLCAYTEMRPEIYGWGWHVEHIKPKSKYPQLTFDYSNLVLSALHSNDLKGMPKKHQFAGHFKDDDYDDVKFISCLEIDCSRYFDFYLDGTVVPGAGLYPEERDRAIFTIDLLNLNSDLLVNARKRLLKEIDNAIADYLANNLDVGPLKEFYTSFSVNSTVEFISASAKRF